jgi:hypothetical protein
MFYGCLTAALFSLLLVCGMLAGLWYAKKMLTDFTSDKPMPLPVAQVSPEEAAATKSRVDAFLESLRLGRPAIPLSLTPTEINGLIASDHGMNDLQHKVRFSIEGGEIKGRMSIPMDQLGLPVFRGRFFNGTGSFNLALNEDGILRLHAKSLEVNGRPLPNAYMDAIKRQNLAEPFMQDPKTRALLEKLKGIRIEEGKLVFEPKVMRE